MTPSIKIPREVVDRLKDRLQGFKTMCEYYEEGTPQRRYFDGAHDGTDLALALLAPYLEGEWMDDKMKAALNCEIEHLDGKHAGKVVVDLEVFETLYDFAAAHHIGPIEAIARPVLEEQ